MDKLSKILVALFLLAVIAYGLYAIVLQTLDSEVDGPPYHTPGQAPGAQLPSDRIIEQSVINSDTVSISDIRQWARRTLSINEIEIARTPSERQKGLSNREFLPEDVGMLFIFDTPGLYGFWMKETLFPIDIVWISQAGKIVHIEREVSPETYPEVFKPPRPAQYVLEVNAGVSSSVQVGDTLIAD